MQTIDIKGPAKVFVAWRVNEVIVLGAAGGNRGLSMLVGAIAVYRLTL
jgi:hypothetical protein